ncbi:MAG: DUF11 domain-containing protein [Ruminiclostridium sp.]|nr:DUF11 domain-containing protein [Ruminiclostridium sp.]
MATFTNQAAILYNNKKVTSNIVTGTISEILAAVKTAVSPEYTAGEPVTYALSLTNSGAADLTGLTVTDDLGTYTSGGLTLTPLTYEAGTITYFVNGALRPAPTVTAGDTLVITDISVPAGGSAVLVYSAVPNEYASPEAGSEITNTVTVTGQAITGVTASATIPAASEAELTITKSLSPAEVTGGAPLTYTFDIANTGSAPEAAAVLSDTFAPVLGSITVTADGTALTTADYTYGETTGEFETTAGAFTIPAASFAQDPQTGVWTVTPGTATVTVSGTL